MRPSHLISCLGKIATTCGFLRLQRHDLRPLTMTSAKMLVGFSSLACRGLWDAHGDRIVLDGLVKLEMCYSESMPAADKAYSGFVPENVFERVGG